MQIDANTIRRYTRYLTTVDVTGIDNPVDTPEIYDQSIRDMATLAEREGNLGWLRLALDALCAAPEGRIRAFAGDGYPYDEDELAALFAHAYRTIWPQDVMSEPGEEEEIEFVSMSGDDWAVMTGRA